MEVFHLLVGLMVLVWVISVFDLIGLRKPPEKLPNREEDSPESQEWNCPSCGISIKTTSETCPWCGWTSTLPEGDTTPGDFGSEQEGFDSEGEECETVVSVADASEDGGEIHAEKSLPSDAGPALSEAVRAILAESLVSGSRESLIKSLVGTDHSFELTVKRVERTIGRYSDPDYRNGRTVSGTIGGTDIEVSVLFPIVLNEKTDSVEPGSTLLIAGVVSDWDSLRKRPTIRAEVT